jgi:hypothetical protein
MFAIEHFVGSLFDQPGDVGGQVAVAVVDPRGGFLDECQGVQHRERHAFLANGKVDQRALGLRAPVGAFRNFDRAQAVCLDTAHAAFTPLSVRISSLGPHAIERFIRSSCHLSAAPLREQNALL